MYAKKLMRHADVPTAEFRIFDHSGPARTYVETRDFPVVVKADGLAAGKGVTQSAKTRPRRSRPSKRIMIKDEFGPKAGREVVVEKRIEGEELSLLALVSGRSILVAAPLPGPQAGPSTATRGRTPAAWGPIARPRSARRNC